MLNTFTTVPVAILALCYALGDSTAFYAMAAEAADVPTPAEKAESELVHAETYYWFGMAEQGNLAAFGKGLRHLDRAAGVVERGPFSDDEKRRYRARIEGLRTDLEGQIEIAHDTLYGLFPMTRFLARSIFADSTSLRTFEVIDDPTVMASTFAAKNLALETIKQWTQRHQLDVVFTSVPHNPALENEALYLFNSHPKYFVHNLREVTDALDEQQLEEFQSGRVTPEIIKSLLDAFGVNDVLVVLVREADVIDGDYFYIVEGEIHHAGQESPTHDFAVMGFSRDRNAQFTPIVLTNLLFLALAYAAFWLQGRFRRRAAVRASTGTFLVMPLAAFATGRCMPWFLGPLLHSIAPIPETLAIVSFWVPCVAGAALTVVPMILVWVTSKRLAKLWPMFGIDARAVAVFVGIGAGAAAHLSVPLFLYMPGSAVAVLVPLTIAVVGIAYLLGRALDGVDRLSMAVSYVPILLALFWGAAVFQCLPSWTWGAAALVAIVCGLPVALGARRRIEEDKPATGIIAQAPEARGAVNPGMSIDFSKLDELAENPRYQKLPEYDGFWRIVEPVLDGRTVHLALHGPRGCGLSATAGAIADDLAEGLAERDREAVRMCGECSQAVGEPRPYGPFQKALAKHFEIELLATPESQLAEIDAALGEVFQSVVPFAGILFPAAGGSAPSATSGEEIVSSIAWTLRRLSRSKTVILLIDDAHWLDDSSKTLLQHLVREFPPGGPENIAIIVASHSRGVFDELGFNASDQAELSFPTSGHQVRILTHGVGLAPTTAEQIVARLGPSTVEQGGLFWLLQVVANLARAGAFVSTDEGIALCDGKWPEDVFIPDEMRDVLAEQLRRFPEYRTVIECAACACDAREFCASVVADALGKPRLELLTELDRIDRETSILYDVRQRDDAFAFQSSFMLDVVRNELRIVELGPASAEAPQIVREYHARLGTVLEKSLEANSNRIYAVANHFYSAGAAFADRGVKYCLQAARASSAVLDFDVAERYLQRAEECARVIGKAATVEAERLDVECRKAHVTGHLDDHTRVANAGAAYLDEHPDCSTRLLLSIAQVHYDAGRSSGDRWWFERSLQIGQRIIDEAKSARDEAIGRHFVGISLPRGQHDERKRQLREALRLMEEKQGDVEDLELLGRIMGSLAEQLSRGNAEERQDARELFERRLRLNETHQIGDARGQAMTHGGLGRLAFFHEPKDIATAAFHFQKDLDISEAIGDQQGLIQMHSLLGACAIEDDEMEKALEHYQRSWDLSRAPISRFFAGIGLLTCHCRTRQCVQFDEVIRQLLDLARDGVPDVCAEDLVAALTSCPSDLFSAEAEQLLEIAQAETALETAASAKLT